MGLECVSVALGTQCCCLQVKVKADAYQLLTSLLYHVSMANNSGHRGVDQLGTGIPQVNSQGKMDLYTYIIHTAIIILHIHKTVHPSTSATLPALTDSIEKNSSENGERQQQVITIQK